MRSDIEKLALLFASSGYSIKSLRELLLKRHRNEREEFVYLVEFLRSRNRDLFLDAESSGYSFRSYKREPSEPVIRELESILRKDSGLTVMDAAQRLSRHIERNMLVDIPPYRPKQSFRSWLEKLIRVVPASELLHLANKVRNEVVHKADSDWSLKG